MVSKEKLVARAGRETSSNISTCTTVQNNSWKTAQETECRSTAEAVATVKIVEWKSNIYCRNKNVNQSLQLQRKTRTQLLSVTKRKRSNFSTAKLEI